MIKFYTLTNPTSITAVNFFNKDYTGTGGLNETTFFTDFPEAATGNWTIDNDDLTADYGNFLKISGVLTHDILTPFRPSSSTTLYTPFIYVNTEKGIFALFGIQTGIQYFSKIMMTETYTSYATSHKVSDVKSFLWLDDFYDNAPLGGIMAIKSTWYTQTSNAVILRDFLAAYGCKVEFFNDSYLFPTIFNLAKNYIDGTNSTNFELVQTFSSTTHHENNGVLFTILPTSVSSGSIVQIAGVQYYASPVGYLRAE